MEALESDKADAEIARAYDIHPVTVSRWKSTFIENGPEVFDSDEQVQEYESEIADLEQMHGKKEAEFAMLKNFGSSGSAGSTPILGARVSVPPRGFEGTSQGRR